MRAAGDLDWLFAGGAGGSVYLQLRGHHGTYHDCADFAAPSCHFLLIAGWNFCLDHLFFCRVIRRYGCCLTALSLAISIPAPDGQQPHALPFPLLPSPCRLLFLFAVVIGTAELTGGIGLNSMGGDVTGGKHYVTIIFGNFGLFCADRATDSPQAGGALYCSIFSDRLQSRDRGPGRLTCRRPCISFSHFSRPAVMTWIQVLGRSTITPVLPDWAF